MKLAEAQEHASRLAGAGVMLDAQPMTTIRAGTMESEFEHDAHRGFVVGGDWAETVQRPALPRRGIVSCPDVAEALAEGGWSVLALRACSHRYPTTARPVPQSTYRGILQGTYGPAAER